MNDSRFLFQKEMKKVTEIRRAVELGERPATDLILADRLEEEASYAYHYLSCPCSHHLEDDI